MSPARIQPQEQEGTFFLSLLREGEMETINVKPVQIIGSCPAHLTLDDSFRIQDMKLDNPWDSNICFLAISQLPIGQGIWQLQSEERFFSHVSCPGCTVQLDRENRVVFLLGHANKWKLCQLISEYLRVCRRHGESEAARLRKEKAIKHQNQGEYLEAAQEMKVALRKLKQYTVSSDSQHNAPGTHHI